MRLLNRNFIKIRIVRDYEQNRIMHWCDQKFGKIVYKKDANIFLEFVILMFLGRDVYHTYLVDRIKSRWFYYDSDFKTILVKNRNDTFYMKLVLGDSIKVLG